VDPLNLIAVKQITAKVVAVLSCTNVSSAGTVKKMQKGKGDRRQGSGNDLPDLRSQWESLLDQVWRSEAEWRLWDRLDAAVRIETLREQRAARLARIEKPAA
jgi:hypothetical protein